MLSGLLDDYLPSSLHIDSLTRGRGDTIFSLARRVELQQLTYYEEEPLATSSFLTVYELKEHDDVVGSFIRHRPMERIHCGPHYVYMSRKPTTRDELMLSQKYKWFGDYIYFIEGDHSCLIGMITDDSIVARKIGVL